MSIEESARPQRQAEGLAPVAPGADRRQRSLGPPSGMERRRGPGRRLSDSLRSAEEGEMTREQFLFLMAINEFKRANEVAFPNWSDVLEVVRLLGYRKTMRSEVKLSSAEDWTEAPDAASNVRTSRQLERHLRAQRDAELAARRATDAKPARPDAA